MEDLVLVVEAVWELPVTLREPCLVWIGGFGFEGPGSCTAGNPPGARPPMQTTKYGEIEVREFLNISQCVGRQLAA